MGDQSPHFSKSEFVCHGFGHPGHQDHHTIVSPRLVAALETLRAQRGGRPLHIVSGYRCRWWNRQIGGAPNSQHPLGTAADIPPGYATVAQAERAGFNGIGRKGKWAVHVDVRPRRARWAY